MKPSAANWHAKRYASGEQSARAMRAARAALLAIPPLFSAGPVEDAVVGLDAALAEHERVRDHP